MLYSELLEKSETLILTHVDAECDQAQVYFPEFNEDDYDKKLLLEQEDHGILLRHIQYERRR